MRTLLPVLPRALLPALLALLTLASVASPRVASAATAQEKKAVELTQQAKEAYRAQRYMQAAMLFKQAYAQVPEPTLLFNAARAYQKGGKLREALPLFRLYLTLATYNDEETRSGRAEAVEHITAIDKELKRQEEARRRAAEAAKRPKPTKPPVTAPPSKPPATTPPATKPPVTTPPATTPPATSPPATTPPATKPPATTPPAGGPPPAKAGTGTPGATVLPPPAIATRKPVRRPKLFSRISQDGWTEREIAAMSFIGGGAALALTGVILHAVAGSTLDGLDADLAAASTTQGDITFYPGLTQADALAAIDRHDRLRVSGSLVLTLGVVAAGVGTWLWLSRKLDDGGKLSLAPVVAPGPNGPTAGWILQGRF